ncbi:hypothetical protein B0H66DRAFT_486611 [Apodospora peruviana]|uniref:F-box domain-containing protein n=1 Tax=Apodospora peruviana TaxID=516989 RepID=A0AAE0LYX8_9PEZI|nr:hypothetical protein B0H66DRAFT_486611 [Apodospora peruviana]
MAGPQIANDDIDPDDRQNDDDDTEPLVDLTQSLQLHSRRSERLRKKGAKKAERASAAGSMSGFLDLPYELMMTIICSLRPRNVFILMRVNKPLRQLILAEEGYISTQIIQLRYGCLEKCFRRPVLMEQVDPSFRSALQSADRPEMVSVYKKPFQHVQPPDQSVLCTCMTCLARWNCLCVAVDFAHWQGNLDRGEPIPVIERGRSPEWNSRLVAANAAVVLHALRSDLWYAAVLEAHLSSTMGSIKRHAANKGNRRTRFRMTDDDMRRGTADFLERGGPPTVDFPFVRDNYYILESFMPHRSWVKEQDRWIYMPAEQHEKDLEIAVRWETWWKQNLQRRRD